MTDADAVVVGAGPNGLAAAIRLAEAGRAVVVLDAADAPGGAVRTEELTLPGFLHDTFSSVYPAAAASPVFARMPLAEHGLEWVHPEACFAHPLPGGRGAALHRDIGATAASLDALHPGDGAAWERFATPFVEHFDAVRAMALSGFPPLGGPPRLLAELGPRRTLTFLRLLTDSALGLGRRLFTASGSRAWLHGAAMHGDVPPSGAGTAMAAAYLDLMGHAVGWPSPRGGAQRLADALVGHLERLGGEVRTRTRVTAVLSAGGRATGVRTEAGDAIRAPIVVATVMPRDLVALTGEDALSDWYRAGLRRFAHGPATVKVDWALARPAPWEHEESLRAGTVHVAGDEEDCLAASAEAHDRWPERPFLLVGQQSIADPTRAPEGRHTAWAYTHGPRNGVDAGARLDVIVERIEAQVERFAPGFRDAILARHVLGPADLERRNANLVDGDVGGGSYRLAQLVFRPLPSVSPYRTPLDGLYLGSAAAFPGGAVHGVPGDAAAAAALRGGSG